MMNLSKGLLFSLATSIFWAMAIVNQRFLLNAGENPLNLTLWINLLAIPFWLFLFGRHSKEYLSLLTRDKCILVFIGIAGSIGVNYLQALALQNTSAVNFSFLYRTIVVFTVIFAWFFFKEKITTKKLILVTFIIIGSYLLTTRGRELSLGLGDIYTLLMAASAAFISNILIKHTISKMHPDLSASVTMIVAVFSLSFLSVANHSLGIPKNLFLIFVGTIFAVFQILTRNRAYKFATASFVTMIVSFTPVFVSLISFPLLGERLDIIQLLGGGLIISSGILAGKLKI